MIKKGKTQDLLDAQKLVIRNLNQQKAETWNELNERNVGLVNFLKGNYTTGAPENVIS